MGYKMTDGTLDNESNHKSGNDLDNRREFTRVNVQIEVGICPDDRATIVGVVSDLSLNGLFIQCSGRVPLGTTCEVQLFLSGRENAELQVEIHGRISRIEDTGMGVGFTGVPLDSLEHLRNLIRFNASDTGQVEDEFEAHVGLGPATPEND